MRLAVLFFSIFLSTGLCCLLLQINTVSIASLKKNITDVAGKTDLTIVSHGGEGFLEVFLDTVLDIEGVISAVPVTQSISSVILESKRKTLTVIGIDVLNDSSVRDYGQQSNTVADPLVFMSQPDSIALSKRIASEYNIQIDQKIKLMTPEGFRRFTVRSFLDTKGTGSAFNGYIGIMDIEAHRMSFGKNGKIDKINVTIADKSKRAQMRQKIQTQLGRAFLVTPPSGQIEKLKNVVMPFQNMLFFFGSLISLMAFFLIVTISRLTVIERQRDLGILRVLGITKTQLFLLVVVEFITIGLIGAGAGALFSWLLTHLFWSDLIIMLAKQSSVSVSMDETMLSLKPLLYITFCGTLATVVAVMPSLKTIISTSPIDALDVKKTILKKNSFAKQITLSVILVSSLLLLLHPISAIGLSSYIIPIIGLIIIAPTTLLMLLRLIQLFTKHMRSINIKLALAYSLNSPQRLEKMIRSLMASLVIIFTISTVQAGFVKSVGDRFITSARPDLYVSARGDFLSPLSMQPIQETLIPILTKFNGVSGVYGQRDISLEYQGKQIHMSSYDEVPPETLEIPYSYIETIDRPMDRAGHELYHSEDLTIMVSESFRNMFHKETDDFLEIGVLGQQKKFRIVGVVRDFSAGGGKLYMARNTYKTLWKDPLVTGIALILKDKTIIKNVINHLEEDFIPSRGLMVTIDKTIKDDVGIIINKSFSSFHLIEHLSVLIALLGFLSLFYIEIQSRYKELSTMRAIGMTKKELSIFIITEALLIGIFSSLLALILGFLISRVIILQALPIELGWVVDFHVNWIVPLRCLGIGLLVALTSSMYALTSVKNLSITSYLQTD